jgi:hypothetical protein
MVPIEILFELVVTVRRQEIVLAALDVAAAFTERFAVPWDKRRRLTTRAKYSARIFNCCVSLIHGPSPF